MIEDNSSNQSRENDNKNEDKTSVVEEKQPVSDKEIGGPKGPEPTRYGDWEKNGRCIDF